MNLKYNHFNIFLVTFIIYKNDIYSGIINILLPPHCVWWRAIGKSNSVEQICTTMGDLTWNYDIYWSNVLTERFSIPYKNQTNEDTSF